MTERWDLQENLASPVYPVSPDLRVSCLPKVTEAHPVPAARLDPQALQDAQDPREPLGPKATLDWP